MKRKLRDWVWAPALVAATATTLLSGCTTSARPTTGGDAASTSSGRDATSRPSAPASGASELPSPWPSAKGTPTQQAAAQAALAAYQGMWNDLVLLGKTSDWKNPEMGRYMTGDVLSSWSSSLAQNKRQGLVLLGATKDLPRVVSVSPDDQPTRVEIADCVSDGNWLQYVAATGKLANPTPGGWRRSEAVVSYDTSWKRWLVSQQMIGEVGTC